MAESYGVDEQNLAAGNLLAGSHPAVTYPVVLGSGAGDLPAGQVLARHDTDYKYYKWDPAGTNDLDTPRAILARATDASSADAPTIGYVHGEFSHAALDWNSANDTQIAAAERELMGFGIYVKTVGG